MKANEINLEELFKDKEYFTRALTHRSWVNEHKGEGRSNERLEFLGDAVLELIVSDVIFKKFTDKEEGYLTVLRASLVNTQSLAKIAKKLNLGKLLLLSKGEEGSGGRENISLLSDTLEAVIGALYLDQGLDACRELLADLLLSNIPKKPVTGLKDSKSLLQEFLQTKKAKPPHYNVVKSFGPAHAKIFTVEVVSEGEVLATATGTSKSIASQKAAKKALLRFGQK